MYYFIFDIANASRLLLFSNLLDGHFPNRMCSITTHPNATWNKLNKIAESASKRNSLYGHLIDAMQSFSLTRTHDQKEWTRKQRERKSTASITRKRREMKINRKLELNLLHSLSIFIIFLHNNIRTKHDFYGRRCKWIAKRSVIYKFQLFSQMCWFHVCWFLESLNIKLQQRNIHEASE